MTRINGLLAIALLCGSAAPALAQGLEFAPGLTLEGDIELQQYHVAGGRNAAVLAPDVTLRWESGGLFGFEGTLDSAYDFGDNEDYTNIWAAATLGFDFGTLKIGAPRPVTETIKPMTSFGSNVLANLDLRGVTGSTTSALSLADGGLTPGLALEGQASDLTWGASLHQVDFANATIDTDFTILEGVMVKEAGAGRYFGALQLAHSDDGTSSSSEFGAVWDSQPVSLGLRVGRENIWYDSTYGQLQIGYEAMPSLNLKADLMRVDVKNGQDVTVYGASAQYDFGANAYLKAGATASSTDSIETYDLSIGWTF